MKSDKNSKELEQLLRSCLHTEQKPDDLLHQKVLRKWKEQTSMKKQRSYKTIAAVIAGALVLSSASVYAASRFLSPKDAAERLENKEVAALFEGKDSVTVNETQNGRDYSFTLLGMTEGKNLLTLDEAGNEIHKDNFYAVVAISNKDGSPLSSEEFQQKSYFISPLVQGLEPWQYNIASMNGGYVEAEVDGVVYRLIDCDKISCFADRKLYLCILDSTFYDTKAYRYDEKTGEIAPDDEYEGTNLLFDLPIDAGRANPDQAKKYLEELKKKWDADSSSDEMADQNTEVSEEDTPSHARFPETKKDLNTLKRLCNELPEDMDSQLIDMGIEVSGRQVVEEKDGGFTFEEDLSDGTKNHFTFGKKDFKSGISTAYQYGESESDGHLYVQVVRLNDDGTATCTFYKKTYRK